MLSLTLFCTWLTFFIYGWFLCALIKRSFSSYSLFFFFLDRYFYIEKEISWDIYFFKACFFCQKKKLKKINLNIEFLSFQRRVRVYSRMHWFFIFLGVYYLIFPMWWYYCILVLVLVVAAKYSLFFIGFFIDGYIEYKVYLEYSEDFPIKPWFWIDEVTAISRIGAFEWYRWYFSYLLALAYRFNPFIFIVGFFFFFSLFSLQLLFLFIRYFFRFLVAPVLFFFFIFIPFFGTKLFLRMDEDETTYWIHDWEHLMDISVAYVKNYLHERAILRAEAKRKRRFERALYWSYKRSFLKFFFIFARDRFYRFLKNFYVYWPLRIWFKLTKPFRIFFGHIFLFLYNIVIFLIFYIFCTLLVKIWQGVIYFIRFLFHFILDLWIFSLVFFYWSIDFYCKYRYEFNYRLFFINKFRLYFYYCRCFWAWCIVISCSLYLRLLFCYYFFCSILTFILGMIFEIFFFFSFDLIPVLKYFNSYLVAFLDKAFFFFFEIYLCFENFGSFYRDVFYYSLFGSNSIFIRFFFFLQIFILKFKLWCFATILDCLYIFRYIYLDVLFCFVYLNIYDNISQFFLDLIALKESGFLFFFNIYFLRRLNDFFDLLCLIVSFFRRLLDSFLLWFSVLKIFFFFDTYVIPYFIFFLKKYFVPCMNSIFSNFLFNFLQKFLKFFFDFCEKSFEKFFFIVQGTRRYPFLTSFLFIFYMFIHKVFSFLYIWFYHLTFNFSFEYFLKSTVALLDYGLHAVLLALVCCYFSFIEFCIDFLRLIYVSAVAFFYFLLDSILFVYIFFSFFFIIILIFLASL